MAPVGSTTAVQRSFLLLASAEFVNGAVWMHSANPYLDNVYSLGVSCSCSTVCSFARLCPVKVH